MQELQPSAKSPLIALPGGENAYTNAGQGNAPGKGS